MAIGNKQLEIACSDGLGMHADSEPEIEIELESSIVV